MLGMLSVGIFCEIQFIWQNVLSELWAIHRTWTMFEDKKQDKNNNNFVCISYFIKNTSPCQNVLCVYSENRSLPGTTTTKTEPDTKSYFLT